MIQHIDISYGHPHTIGYIQLIEWVSIDHDEPQGSGHYLVADGKGHTRQVDFALYNFQNVLFKKYPILSETKIYWHDSGEELTAGELVSVIDCGHVWYYTGVQEDIEGCPETLLIAIMTTSDFEFWIDANDIFHGPTEIDLNRSPHHVTKNPIRFKHNDEDVIQYITTVNLEKTE